MNKQLSIMLALQDKMNLKVHEAWRTQGFAWFRAIWIECGELVDHYGYKWWKQQFPDIDQVRLEIVDIWHFGMSAMFAPELSTEALADRIVADIQSSAAAELGVREATEALAAINEGKRIAQSTMTAILGRMAAYTGSQVEWDFVTKESKLDLVPANLDLGADMASAGVAAPGRTKLV